MTLQIFLASLHSLTFLLYNLNYAKIRNDKKYADGKTVVEALPLVRIITKIAFTSSTLITLFCLISNNSLLLKQHDDSFLQIFGVTFTFCAFLFLKYSLSNLGSNYSPCYDSHKPHSIVRTGPYRWIRHPVYLANILMMIGYVISSGSLYVLIFSFWGLGQMLRSLLIEEKLLSREFNEYRDYQKTTWRLIPFIF